MMPHTLPAPSCSDSLPAPETPKSPAICAFPASGRSAELSPNEVGDGTTRPLGVGLILGLRKHANEGFRARRPHHHATAVGKLVVEALDFGENAVRDLLPGDANVLEHLWEARHHRRRLRER